VLVHRINPLRDFRWSSLVSGHPLATVFHDARWLEALRATYHYEPVAFTSSNPREVLENGWVFCQIDSWLTGRRLVSLPFSDHCDPLIGSAEELDAFAGYLQQQREGENWSYVEARPLTVALATETFHPSSSYLAQQLPLAPTSDQLFARLHHDSIRRKIRRAEREGVIVREDRSGALLEQFYYLQSMTRRRHRLPPQPPKWFRNVVRCFGDSCAIYVASLHGQPIASVLTLRFRKTLVYKYGASDARFHALGAMPLLFWRIIEQAKDQGLEDLDLGRSDLGDVGLITFKEHLGAHGHQIYYFRQRSQQSQFTAKALPKFVVNGLCSLMPSCVTNAAGKVLYRHIG
jgi:CelD/BcsL family acetyltransferase involved in cellulose biosynthesis